MTTHHKSLTNRLSTGIRALLSSHVLALPLVLTPGCDDGAGRDDDRAFEQIDEEERSFFLFKKFKDLEARESIRDIAACYGQGHDSIFTDLGGDQAEALGILSGCFTEDVHSEVFFPGGTEPAAELESLDELVGFIEQFAIDTGYTGARNNVGNTLIELHGDGTATLTSSTVTPHFIAPTGAELEPTVDLVSARYVDEVVLQNDGVWRTYAKTLIIDEFWRGAGVYPLAGG